MRGGELGLVDALEVGLEAGGGGGRHHGGDGGGGGGGAGEDGGGGGGGGNGGGGGGGAEGGGEGGGGERGGEHGGSGWGGDAQLAAGVLVEPRRGRLVLFSGGGENYHAPLPVAQGRRTSFQVWFGCDCDV